jgi:heme oxygenase
VEDEMGSQTELAELGRRPGGSAVAMLRRETRVAHRRLERELGVMSPDLLMDEYRRLLVGFAALHQTLDDEIGAQLQCVTPPDAFDELHIDERRRMPSLMRDFDRLGIAPPRRVAFPLTSMAGALGALYVSEGATLGGSVIGPHVRAVLGGDTPVEFFESSGVDVQARWASCRGVINRLLVARSDRTEAARVAVAVFDRFSEVLGR